MKMHGKCLVAGPGTRKHALDAVLAIIVIITLYTKGRIPDAKLSYCWPPPLTLAGTTITPDAKS